MCRKEVLQVHYHILGRYIISGIEYGWGGQMHGGRAGCRRMHAGRSGGGQMHGGRAGCRHMHTGRAGGHRVDKCTEGGLGVDV